MAIFGESKEQLKEMASAFKSFAKKQKCYGKVEKYAFPDDLENLNLDGRIRLLVMMDSNEAVKQSVDLAVHLGEEISPQTLKLVEAMKPELEDYIAPHVSKKAKSKPKKS